MQHRPMRGVDRPLPMLGLGAMRLPLGPDGRIDRAAATSLVRHAVDCGVTYIDTAWVYHDGESEPFLGEALEDGYRERVQLATKLPVWAVQCRADMDRFLDLQRERLRTDAIDFYLLHGLNRAGWERARELGVLEFLDNALAAGLIRHASFSFHDDLQTFRSIVDAYDWTFAQVQYNYVDVHTQGGLEAVQYASERGLGVVVMEPLRGGTLARPVPGAAELWARAGAGRTPADWALSWLWDQPEVTVVLSGMNTLDQLRANIACAERARPLALSRRELAVFDEVRALYRGRGAVACTRCGYCRPCPSGVDIPRCFELYNDAILLGDPVASRSGYRILSRYGGGASSCTDCGVCEERCPQGLVVRTHLKDLDAFFG
ncbi:MAG: aldo/keto reductase [Methanoregulaceae archaeon]